MPVYAQRKRGNPVPWPLIIFFFFFFFPVGLILFIVKACDRTNYGPNGAVILKTGIVFTCLDVGFFLLCVPHFIAGEKDYNLTTFLILCAVCLGGIAIIIWGLHLKKLSVRYDRYEELIRVHQMASLEGIASTMSLPYKTVHRDIKNIIHMGYLHNVAIDETRKILFRPANAAVSTISNNLPETMLCKSCGAESKVSGAPPYLCEYCGSPLE